MINVTKSIMPDIDRYIEMMGQLWSTRYLTNEGPFLKEFERKLRDRLGVPGVALNSGTTALQIALELFDFLPGDEIITTPFSFIATASTISWQKFTPIFADIDIETFNIDPDSIREKITDKTRAILAVHTFGNPCDITTIQAIAKEFGLKIIYDAAHCFGTTLDDGSIFSAGDVSTTSFHATKVFHTIEGGALFSNDTQLLMKATRMHRFGIDADRIDADSVQEVGINGKMNEFQAIMGILNLENVDLEISHRKSKVELYKELLDDFVTFQKISPEIKDYNYCYMPVVFENKHERDRALTNLRENNVHAKLYFKPINRFPAFAGDTEECQNADNLSSRVLTLPLYGVLEDDEVEFIVNIIRNG